MMTRGNTWSEHFPNQTRREKRKRREIKNYRGNPDRFKYRGRGRELVREMFPQVLHTVTLSADQEKRGVNEKNICRSRKARLTIFDLGCKLELREKRKESPRFVGSAEKKRFFFSRGPEEMVRQPGDWPGLVLVRGHSLERGG